MRTVRIINCLHFRLHILSSTLEAARPRASLLVPLTIASAFFMEGLDSTIISTCLPQIAAAFGVHISAVSSAITTYLVSIAVFLPLSGWLADRLEARRVYCAAIAVFAAGSVVCGFSTDATLLVAGRAIQGLGGALMAPVGRLILVRTFPRGELVHAMSFMIIPGLVGPMLGPVVGGFIATYAEWRWIFFINVPLAAIAILLALINVQRLPAATPAPFDFRGFVLAAVTFASLQASLSVVSAAPRSPAAAALLATALLSGALYVLHARGQSAPVIRLSMFRHRVFRIAMVGGSLARIGIAVPAFLVPILLQEAFGYSAFHAGVLMVAQAVGQIVLRFFIKPIYRHVSLRALLLANAALLVLMLAGFAAFSNRLSDVLLFVYLFLFGGLQSIMLSTLAALCFSGIPADAAGQATTISSVAQRFSLALGIALCAFALQCLRPDGLLRAADFIVPFIGMAVLQSLSMLSFRAMQPGDGADIAARR